MTPAQLKTVTDAFEALDQVRAGNLGPAGWWKRIALAAEGVAGVSSSANSTITGYMKRTAVALETISGTSGAEENASEAGYLKRIAEAMEVETGVGTGSFSSRIVTAAATFTGSGGGGSAWLLDGGLWNDAGVWSDADVWEDA